MAEKIKGVEVKGSVYDIEDTDTKSIAESALTNANDAITLARQTEETLEQVDQRVVAIEENIGTSDISEIETNASTALQEIGDMSKLVTVDKSTLVGAINEQNISAQHVAAMLATTNAQGRATINLFHAAPRAGVVLLFPTSDAAICTTIGSVKKGDTTVTATFFTTGSALVSTSFWVGGILL